MILRQQIKDKIVTPITYENEIMHTVAFVVKSDDKNNCCDIRYIDRQGQIRNKDNVTVRLTGSGMDWFPVKGEFVTIEVTRDICVIIARCISNYNMEVRSKMELKQDIYSDSGGYPPGASIY